jgi:hypothetical protein
MSSPPLISMLSSFSVNIVECKSFLTRIIAKIHIATMEMLSNVFSKDFPKMGIYFDERLLDDSSKQRLQDNGANYTTALVARLKQIMEMLTRKPGVGDERQWTNEDGALAKKLFGKGKEIGLLLFKGIHLGIFSSTYDFGRSECELVVI